MAASYDSTAAERTAFVARRPQPPSGWYAVVPRADGSGQRHCAPVAPLDSTEFSAAAQCTKLYNAAEVPTLFFWCAACATSGRATTAQSHKARLPHLEATLGLMRAELATAVVRAFRAPSRCTQLRCA